MKAVAHAVFQKFYIDRARKPVLSDAFDLAIVSATPYVEAFVTESHQTDVLRQIKTRDPFIEDLLVVKLKDFRQAAP